MKNGLKQVKIAKFGYHVDCDSCFLLAYGFYNNLAEKGF